MRAALGHGSTTDTLNPANVPDGFMNTTHYTITNMLTEIAQDGSLQPKLAESWEASDDASTWVFRVRKGVTFHNGRDVTAADVIASIDHHRREDSESSARPLVAPITELRKDDSHTVVMELEAGDADMAFKLADFNFPIYPANDDGTLDWASGNGCGAYRLAEMEPGVRAAYERNPDYWQAGERAFFESCELISIKDTTARTNALITGEVEAIDRIELATAGRLDSRDGVSVKEVSGKVHYTFPMRTDTAPFDDVNVRLAVKHGIDRQAMLDTILSGHGTIGNDTPISPAYRYHNADMAQRTYDPDRARWHLKQAGMDSLAIELAAADTAFAGALDAAVLYREQAAPAGIDITVNRVAEDGYWSNVWMKVPFCACYWFGTATEDGILTQAYSAGAGWNDTYWDNAQFNDLLLAARAELDDARRRQMYAEMQELIRDDGGVVVPLFANDVFALSDKVGHGTLGNDHELDGRKFFERWWFV